MLSGYIAGAIMKQEVILVLDCGATNVRAIAVNRQGKIVARASTPNASDIAPFCNALLIAVGKSIVN